ncbi:phosphotransferase family protein [Brevibacterium daeguense]|nr:phosphotransferase family protein [Brevibacterium daeguense]
MAVDFDDLNGELAGRLGRWAHALWSDAEGITRLHRMPGNAGLSFGFEVIHADGQARHERTRGRRASGRAGYVIRFAPPGVRRKGNTDVLRQVPLLEFLATTEVPVAELVWSTSDPAWFGTDAIVQEYLDGSSLGFRDPKWSAQQHVVEQAVEAAVGVLHTIHSAPAVEALPDWEVQRSVAEEAALWSRLLEKSAEGEVLEQGRALRDALLASEPQEHRIGLTHGDFQTNNVLFDIDALAAGDSGGAEAGDGTGEADNLPGIGSCTADTGTVQAVVDWELASIGPVGRDLGWLAMMLDPEVWAPEWAEKFPVRLGPDFVVQAYERHSRGAAASVPSGSGSAATVLIGDFDWYKAYACFKYGAILSFNHYLHVTGKRIDPIYESLASSRPVLFEAGISLIG